MKRINVNLYPRDGYYFREGDGAKIVGTSWPNVMRRVEDYRKRAGRPVGNVEAEVSNQACSRNPANCSEVSAETQRMTLVASLKGRVLQYASFLRGLGKRIPWVSAQDAANRANVCATCPNNTALPEGCATCRVALKAMRDEILGRGRKQDARLNGCSVLGEDIVMSCHVDHDVVDSDALPAHCWRKRRNP
jgi:hypothetical protein